MKHLTLFEAKLLIFLVFAAKSRDPDQLITYPDQTKSSKNKKMNSVQVSISLTVLRLTLNFRALRQKKLFKSWAQGMKVGRRGAKPFMKSTPGGTKHDA